MKVIAVVEHKHGKGHYLKDQEYDLEPKDAYFLIGNGWMREPDQEAAPRQEGDVSLDIHNAQMGMVDSNG